MKWERIPRLNTQMRWYDRQKDEIKKNRQTRLTQCTDWGYVFVCLCNCVVLDGENRQ